MDNNDTSMEVETQISSPVIAVAYSPEDGGESTIQLNASIMDPNGTMGGNGIAWIDISG